MSDLDLLEALSPRRDFYAFAKEASAGDMAQTALQVAKSPEFISAVATGLLATGITFASNRKGKSGKSKGREAAEDNARNSAHNMADMKRRGVKPGFMQKLRAATAPAMVGIERVAEEHPLRSALLTSFGPGAMTGAKVIAPAIKRLL